MRTLGPRMNAERTREVLDKLAIPVIKSNARGYEIHRAVGAGTGEMYTERWRVLTGGGLVANSHQVWLSPIIRVHGEQSRGPYWNKTQLEKALRTWRRGA